MALILVLALAALAVWLAARLLMGSVSLLRADGGEAGPDPQFAEPAERVTRPPELAGESGMAPLEGDSSDGWELGEQTQVDKTAGELAREMRP